AAVGVDLAVVGVGHDDGAVGSAVRRPDHVGGGVGRKVAVDDEGEGLGRVELGRLVGQAVVHGVVDAVGARVADGQLVDDDPFFEGRDLGHDRHARPRDVLVVGDVVDD